ncbi:hypothetical protein P0082_02435 [Candidatus Haliotispira prima]|uniref:Virion structural protein n=1 Tax=Candidatus Haliotispira prima TaxID=3034016 RepID=A0ABY8MIA7_9SPIO|nr:hypothetical protein P0082_02435 [Candidatus Haliotispira prima]
MAWVSMREGLVQLDNGTEGVKTIGVVVSRETEPAAYASVKDLPGFYTRKTKADGTPRTVYLSMTDKMTVAKFNANITISVDGQATGFVSAVTAAPELLHPNTKYYAHFYEITDATGTTIEKLEFTTENFPSTYPTTRGRYSSLYDKVAAGSTSPAIEHKTSESYLLPFRYHYLHRGGGPYAFTVSNRTYEFSESSTLMRPFSNSTPPGVFYDLYNMAPSGPGTNVELWDTVIRSGSITDTVRLDEFYGGDPSSIIHIRNSVLVTE